MKRLQIIKKVKSRQFFFRVFYYFSVLLMLTVILMAATYFVTNRGVESQYYDKMQYNLEEVSKTVDSQVEMVQNLGLNFFAADVIGQYFKPDAQRTVEINAEQWRVVRVILQNKTIFGDALNELYAYFQGENRVYTAAGVYEADFFFENVCKYEEYPLEFWQTERMKDNDGMNVLLPSIVERTGDRTSIEVIPVVTAQNLSGKTAVFVANLSSPKIKDILTSTSILGDTRFLVLNREKEILIDTDHSGGEAEKLLGAFEEESTQAVYHGEDDDFLVFRKQSEQNGWTYISMVPMSSFNQVMNMNLYFIVVIGLTVVLLGITLALTFTMRIYRPINTLVEKLPSKEKKDSSMDELQFLQQGVNLLLANEKQYEKNIRLYDKKYVEHSLQLAVNGIAAAKQNEVMDILKNQYGFLYDTYVCCNIIFDFTLEYYREIGEKSQAEMTEKLRDVLEVLAGSICKCCIVEMVNGNYICAASVEGKEQVGELSRGFAQMERIFENDSAYYTVAIGIGSLCEGLENLSASYSQAMFALQQRNRKAAFQIISYDSLPVKNRVSFTFYDQKKIVNCIKTGKADALSEILAGIVTDNKKRGISANNMLELYRQLLAVGKRCLEEQELVLDNEELSARVKSVFFENEDGAEFETAKQLLQEYLQEVLVLINGRETSAGNKMVDTIKRYVLENYTGDLSLDRIGTELGISPKYMSRLFKQKSGENLTDYINVVRIEKAKEILTTTNVKIGDIAAMVGLESRATFLRVFKKLEGVSPNEYRNSYSSFHEQ